jgi:hypothetical protein
MVGAQIMQHNKNMGNKLGTWWEHDENKLGTKENEKKPFPPLLQSKKKKSGHLECMQNLELPISYMQFLSPKLFVTSFGLG